MTKTFVTSFMIRNSGLKGAIQNAEISPFGMFYLIRILEI